MISRRGLVAAGIGLLALSGCDGGSAEDAATTVSVRSVAGTGDVLVNTDGRALYTTDQETGGKVVCTSADCLAVWIPLTVADSNKPTGPDELSDKLATVDRPDGKRQVTYEGKPIYTFALDRDPGVVNGNGVSDTFAGTKFTWHAVTTSGTAPTSAPTSGDDGYGY